MSLGLPCLIKKEDFSKKLRQIASCLIFFSVKCQNSAGSALDCLDLIYWLRTLLLWSITFYIFLKNQKGSDIFWESLKNSKNLLYNCWQNTKLSAELLCCAVLGCTESTSRVDKLSWRARFCILACPHILACLAPQSWAFVYKTRGRGDRGVWTLACRLSCQKIYVTG